MRRGFRIFIVLIFGMISHLSLFAQGALCSDIEPFCAGEQRLTFPNSNPRNSNQSTGESGPFYGCLEEQPYPSWFFLQIEDSGDLTFKISQYSNSNGTGAPLDVDFVVWGPFQRGDNYCSPDALSGRKIIDCSYLPDAVEIMNIPQAQADEIYIVVITNFEQVQGYISLEQTNRGAGSTDCSILELDLGDMISVCDEDQYILDGTSDEDVIYEWYIFNETTAAYEIISGENGPTLTVNESGNYKLIITDEVEGKTEEDEVEVIFYDSPLIGEVSMLSVCDVNAEFIDLTEIYQDLVAPNSSSNFRVIFYENEEDIANNDFISQPENYVFEDGKTIYAQIMDRESGCTSPIENFTLEIFDFPEFNLSENTIFCVDENMSLLNSVTIGEDLGEGYFYRWSDGNNLLSEDAVITLNEFPVGPQISVIIEHPESGCTLEFKTTPVMVSRPGIVNVEISGSDFGDGYVIEVLAEEIIGEEFAEFSYRLDNGPWQESNIFNNVPPGSHTVSVQEINGCGITSSESFFLVGYPRFFTPNADGFNDVWNLITDNNITIKKLYVFDRYGKLITSLDPSKNGWDGQFNGTNLPADDYWFRVEFIDERTGRHQEYMSNFSLIR